MGLKLNGSIGVSKATMRHKKRTKNKDKEYRGINTRKELKIGTTLCKKRTIALH